MDLTSEGMKGTTGHDKTGHIPTNNTNTSSLHNTTPLISHILSLTNHHSLSHNVPPRQHTHTNTHISCLMLCHVCNICYTVTFIHIISATHTHTTFITSSHQNNITHLYIIYSKTETQNLLKPSHFSLYPCKTTSTL